MWGFGHVTKDEPRFGRAGASAARGARARGLCKEIVRRAGLLLFSLVIPLSIDAFRYFVQETRTRDIRNNSSSAIELTLADSLASRTARENFFEMDTPIQWATSSNERETQLLTIVEGLRMQIQALRQHRTVRQVLPEPDKFGGRTKDWDTWSMAMKAKLRIDERAIGDKEAQFYYVFSSLDKKVQGLVLPFVRQSQDNENWEPTELLDYLGRV